MNHLLNNSQQQHNQQFGSEDDEDDDDASMIVYKEKVIPFSLSQNTVKTHHTQTQTTKAESESSSPFPKLAAKKATMTRQERRKRHQEWRERQQQQTPSYSAMSPEESSEALEEDAFAALQSLLGGGVSQSQTEVVGQSQASCHNRDPEKENNENEHEIMCEKQTSCLPETNGIHVKEQHPPTVPQEEPPPRQSAFCDEDAVEPSPPDFVMYNDDDEDDDDAMQVEEEPPRLSTRDGMMDSQKSTNKKRRREKIQKMRQRAASKTFSAPEFATPQSPQSRHHASSISSHMNHRSEMRNVLSMPSSQRLSQHAATQVQNANSIVGSRPMHWHRNKIQPRSAGNNPRAQRLAKAATLAAATRMPLATPRLSPPKAPRPSREMLAPTNSTTLGNYSRAPRATVPITFAPSFMSSAPRRSLEPVEDSGELLHGLSATRRAPATTTTTATPAPFSSPPTRRRRSKSKTGPWVRRLATIRSARSNDAVRLQHQAFCRKNNAIFDLNNPRKRAKSHTDITILGQCSGPWGNAAEDAKFHVLGCLHGHVRTGETNAAAYENKNEFAWVSFTFATARSVNLRTGLQLRIYNAVVIPCRQPVTITEKRADSLMSNQCRHMVVCTHLCETYPSELEPLPTIAPMAGAGSDSAAAMD